MLRRLSRLGLALFLGAVALGDVGCQGTPAGAIAPRAAAIAGVGGQIATNVLDQVGAATGSPGVGLARDIVGTATDGGMGKPERILDSVARYTGDPNVAMARDITAQQMPAVRGLALRMAGGDPGLSRTVPLR